VKPVNQHDTIILPETLTALVDFTHRIGIDLSGSALTLDTAFDSQDNKDLLKVSDPRQSRRLTLCSYHPV
jgi:hypothetical protein